MCFGITSQVLQVVAYGGSWCWEGQGSCHGLRGWWGILWGCRAWSDHCQCLQYAVRRSGFGLIKTWTIGLVGVIIFLFILYVLNVWLLQATSSRSGGCLVMKGSWTLFILLINYLSDLPLRMRRFLKSVFSIQIAFTRVDLMTDAGLTPAGDFLIITFFWCFPFCAIQSCLTGQYPGHLHSLLVSVQDG